ncbi:MAG: glycosyltransferase [Endomicrobia bacterium]|nr:glycosyltransferase [Endomicrobiia bacterium]
MHVKKKCLLILPRKIFPYVGGYPQKNKKLIEILNKHYDLSVVIISNSKITSEEKDFFNNNTAEFYYFTISKLKYLCKAFLSVFSRESVHVAYFYFDEVSSIIDKILPQQDIAVGVYVRTMKYLQNAPDNCKVIFDMTDSIGLNYKNSQKLVSSLFWRLFYMFESGKLLRHEKYWVERADVTLLFNRDERDYWQKYGNARLVPHGVNEKLLTYNTYSEKYDKSVVFLGKMDYQPNIDAVKWYVKNIHGKIGSKIPFIIAGACPTHEIFKLAENNSNITVTGFVEDPFVILKSAMAVVAPMQTGSGIQNKVLEAMALGSINVITPLAAKAIVGAEDGKDFLIAGNAQEFCEKITDIADNPGKYGKIKTSSREFIAKNYTWQNYEHVYISEIERTTRNAKH